MLGLPAITDAAGVMAAMSRIAEAAGAGEITLDEASALIALVEACRRGIETVDLERRIAALEMQSDRGCREDA